RLLPSTKMASKSSSWARRWPCRQLSLALHHPDSSTTHRRPFTKARRRREDGSPGVDHASKFECKRPTDTTFAREPSWARLVCFLRGRQSDQFWPIHRGLSDDPKVDAVRYRPRSHDRKFDCANRTNARRRGARRRPLGETRSCLGRHWHRGERPCPGTVADL